MKHFIFFGLEVSKKKENIDPLDLFKTADEKLTAVEGEFSLLQWESQVFEEIVPSGFNVQSFICICQSKAE